MGKEFYKRHLPHIQPKGGLFFVTYSLKGSIPKKKLIAAKEKYDALQKKAFKTDEEKNELKILAKKKYIQNIKEFLQSSINSPHYLRDNSIAKIVSESLHYWDNKSIELYCYCIMSNHVHVILRLLDEKETENEKMLNEVMHSIKRFSAREANKILCRQGQFWEEESFDYLIRNAEELGRIIAYILDNPIKAGLCKERKDWRWTYIKKDYNEFM